MKHLPLIVITGPTAVGKTKLAVAVANQLGGEIINADSRQVYQEMDIGTGKDLEEYKVDGKIIPYHLINICKPGYKYNIKEYQVDFENVYSSLKSKMKPAVLCGGSGLYIESALEGNPFAFIPIDNNLREELHDESKASLIRKVSEEVTTRLNITTLTTPKRLIRAVEISNYLENNPTVNYEEKAIKSLIFAIELDRKIVLDKILLRLRYRLDNGMIEEVEKLLRQGISPEQLMYYGLEYRWLTMYLLNEMTYDQMFDRLNISIRQFAKRQMTWFRRMEKKGYLINWLDGEKSVESLMKEVLSRIS